MHENKKIHLLITVVGPECCRTIESLFNPECPSTKTYEQFTKIILNYNETRANEMACRYLLYKSCQKKHQCVILKNLTQT